MQPGNPYGAPAAGVVPLSNLGNLIVPGHHRMSRGLITIVLVVVVGCCLVHPVLLVLLADNRMPSLAGWVGSAVVLLGQGWWIWHEVRVVLRARRGGEPKRYGERLAADRIDIAFVDGTFRSLPLHAADLRFEEVAGSIWVPSEQHVLAATGHDGRPVRVLIANTPRRARVALNAASALRQPDRVLAAIAAVAERSPHPAGPEAAAWVRGLIGTQMTWSGWVTGSTSPGG